MKMIVVASVVVLVTQASPVSADSGSDAPKCKHAAQSIIRKTGAKPDRISPSGDSLYLKHPDATTITLFCSRYYDPFASVTRDVASPPAGFYALVSNIAAILFPGSSAAFRAASVKCQNDALKSGGETASVSVGGATLDCKATKEDGGSTSIKIGSEKAG